MVITGASTGIGRSAARLFAREGAHLVLGDVDEVGGQDTAEEIRAVPGGGASFCALT